MTTLTAARVAELPRVNLLPPEIGQAAQLRRLQVLLGLVLIAVLGMAATLYFWAGGQATNAQGAYDNAQTEGQQLATQAQAYAEVPVVEGQVDATRQALVTAMAPEIRWSYLLNDMSLNIPKTSRLQTWDAVNNAAADQIASASSTLILPPTDDTTGALPPSESSIGTVTFESHVHKVQDIAPWLNMLARDKTYFDPELLDATLLTGDTVGKVYDVHSDGGITVDAASGRYQQVMEGK